MLTKEDGSVVEQRSYEAFGARRNASWGSAAAPAGALTTAGFTGQESEEDLGVVNMKGRIYDPKGGAVPDAGSDRRAPGGRAELEPLQLCAEQSADAKVLDAGTPEARVGRALGEIVGGVFSAVAGPSAQR